jgi:hypothetical protein
MSPHENLGAPTPDSRTWESVAAFSSSIAVKARDSALRALAAALSVLRISLT